MPVAPQEEVDLLDVSYKGNIETTVVHSLGCIVRDERKPYPIYKLICSDVLLFSVMDHYVIL